MPAVRQLTTVIDICKTYVNIYDVQNKTIHHESDLDIAFNNGCIDMFNRIRMLINTGAFNYFDDLINYLVHQRNILKEKGYTNRIIYRYELGNLSAILQIFAVYSIELEG